MGPNSSLRRPSQLLRRSRAPAAAWPLGIKKTGPSKRKTRVIGAADETRTHDIYLGKVVLYQLSYGRVMRARRIRSAGEGVNGVHPEKYRPNAGLLAAI